MRDQPGHSLNRNVEKRATVFRSIQLAGFFDDKHLVGLYDVGRCRIRFYLAGSPAAFCAFNASPKIFKRPTAAAMPRRASFEDACLAMAMSEGGSSFSAFEITA